MFIFLTIIVLLRICYRKLCLSKQKKHKINTKSIIKTKNIFSDKTDFNNETYQMKIFKDKDKDINYRIDDCDINIKNNDLSNSVKNSLFNHNLSYHNYSDIKSLSCYDDYCQNYSGYDNSKSVHFINKFQPSSSLKMTY